MSDKAPSTKNYDKKMLEKQKQNRKKQKEEKVIFDNQIKITRDLESFRWEEPVVKVVSKKKSQNEVLGGPHLKYTQKSYQQNKSN